MKHLLTSSICFFSLGAILLCCEKVTNSETIDNKEFQHPGSSDKLHTWWHWVDGAISKEGITKDLEAMKAQGIVQATILNVSLFKGKNFGVPTVIFGSGQWYDMFDWALQEANRLGITIGAHNCDGWSSSGGPWITPDQSMKTFTWSKTLIGGGLHISLPLSKPYARDNYYRDVAVVAYPATNSPSSYVIARPVITLNDTTSADVLADASPVSALTVNRGYIIKFNFTKKYTAQKISILPRKEFIWNDPKVFNTKYILSASDDDKNYRTIKEFEIIGLNESKEIVFGTISARFYRLEIKDFGYTDSWLPLTMAEIELLQTNESPQYQPTVPYHQDKAICIKAGNKINFETKGSGVAIDSSQVIDITDMMDKDGIVNWDAPAGQWNIIRFGYTTTSARNAPASQEGEGLECDKMDSVAVRYHFSQYPQKLIDKAGSMTGKTFKFLLIDSWECAYQNWTKQLPAEFASRRGYDIRKYIPVLCGETVGDAATSEAFLYDFRKTIADLIETNYYRQFSTLCHKNNLEMHSEVIYGNGGYPPVDVLKANSYADMPMFEFWSGHGKNVFPEYTPQKNTSLEFQASAALFYDKKILGAEAYTAMAHYSEAPWDLKSFGDRAFCTGINQMILHSYVHQPTDSVPGMTLGGFASHFNRNNPWFSFASSWIEYQSRIQYMLRQGQMQADILYFIGDQLPQFIELNNGNTAPQGYKLHVCNHDILQNKLQTKEGKLTFGNVRFSLLTLSDISKGMELATLKRISQLVNDGVVLYGPKPMYTLSMQGLKKDKAQFDQLADKLWGNINGTSVIENNVGKGKVYWGCTMGEVLNKIKLKPDFEVSKKDSNNLLYTHRVTSKEDIFFVFNQLDQQESTSMFFRTPYKKVAYFNPADGSIRPLAMKETKDGRVSINFDFTPKASALFVFSNTQPEDLSPAKGSPNHYAVNELKGNVRFDTKGPGKVPDMPLSKLGSLTQAVDTDIKYFSGIAHYDLQFKLASEILRSSSPVYIHLGEIGSTASITLNGIYLGTAWMPGTQIEVTGNLREINRIQMDVGTAYRNRIIGDYITYGSLKNIWTSANIGDMLHKELPLKASGWIGPLQIVTFKN